MIGQGNLRDWELAHWTKILTKEIEGLDIEGQKSFSNFKDLCPENVCKLLTAMGYNEIDFYYESDYIFFEFSRENDNYHLYLYVNTMLFTMSLTKGDASE